MTLTAYLREHGKTMRVYDIDNATWVFCDPRDPLKTERVPADSVELSYDNPFGIGMAEWPLKFGIGTAEWWLSWQLKCNR